ncbi:MAG: glycosyltransferase family 2 protein [Fibrobacter sp.]|nr:glycosyltransferase family 2 protein [Fibrobacter sp.]
MDLSIVIPVKNEAESLAKLLEEINIAVKPLELEYEVIVIDDGSTDQTWATLQDLSGGYTQLRAVKLQYNCGKATALALGFSKAKGDKVITMDGDLQDNPNEIPGLLQKLDEGYDLVSGWKKRRFDPWHKTIPSKLYNVVVSIVAGIRLHDFNCGLKAYRREVVMHLPLYGDYHRFIPVMAKWRGFKITEMVVEHRPRIHGVSKYGASRLISGFLDLVSLLFLHRFAVKPLHFFGSIGLLFVLMGAGLLGYFGVQWLITGALHIRPLMFGGGLLLLTGLQLGSLGLLGEMLNSNTQRSVFPIAASIRVKEE